MRLVSQINVVVSALAIVCVAGGSQAQPPAKPREPSVEGLTVTPPIAPVPQVGAGAPMLTIEELNREIEQAHTDRTTAVKATTRCDPRMHKRFGARATFPVLFEQQRVAEGIRMDAAEVAKEATEESVAARIAAAQGAASSKEVEEAELKRQRTVNELLKRQHQAETAKITAATLQEVTMDLSLDNSVARRRIGRMKGEEVELMLRLPLYIKAQKVSPETLAEMRKLEIVDVHVNGARDGSVLLVKGRIHNPEAKAITFPTLAFTAAGADGAEPETRLLHASPGGKVRAKSSAPFSYRFVWPPKTLASLLIEVSDGSTPPKLLPAELFCDRISASKD